MKRMEEEMDKFRDEVMNKDDFFKSSRAR